MIQYIRDLSKKELSKDGYKKLIALMNHFIYKYRWPKQILDEAEKGYSDWKFEEIVLFTHQFVLFLFEKDKLKNINKIPDEYIEYYFHQIIVTYVASKIQQTQKKEGISFETVKRIVKGLQKVGFNKTELKGKVYWTKSDRFNNKVLPDSEIERQVGFLPKILLGPGIKHFKKHVIKAVDNIFSLTETSFEENLLIKLSFSLFDQTPFIKAVDKQSEEFDIDEDAINHSINEIVQKVELKDLPIIISYFFIGDQPSLKELAEKHDIPKSTIHYKINGFKELLQGTFNPKNDEEGLLFLKKLHKKLDERL